MQQLRASTAKNKVILIIQSQPQGRGGNGATSPTEAQAEPLEGLKVLAKNIHIQLHENISTDILAVLGNLPSFSKFLLLNTGI